MTPSFIRHIVEASLFPEPSGSASLVETHISWVILTPVYAYKIKKPVKFDFLDFSTPALRKQFCEEEFRLNSRLAPDLYIGVLPVSEQGIGRTEPDIIDYALQMHRMDNEREMDKLLEQGVVNAPDLEGLAEILASFHLKNRLPSDFAYDPEEEAHDFADLFALAPDLSALSVNDAGLLTQWAEEIPEFLHTHRKRSLERIQKGFWVEGHGDLHTRNIFLPKNSPPVVFDCLEFNRHFRCSDVLNELAFLCMDLAFFQKESLAEAFMKAYQTRWKVIENTEDELLFLYYKAYRANVRLKVTLLALRQNAAPALIRAALRYWELLKFYVWTLEAAH